MLLRLPLLLLFSCVAFRSLAQAYEPGWLLRSTGDTLRGEIENSFWQEPPTAVRFRASAAAASELLQPRQLRAFSVGGRYFRYEALPVDHAASTELDALPRGNYLNVRTDSLLAEVLLEGEVSVLRVYRPSAPHYYFLRANQPPVAVWARRYLKMGADGYWHATDGNNYQSQLFSAFLSCPAATQAARQAAFTPEHLVAVAQAYNATCGTSRQPGRSWLVPALQPRPVALQGGLLAGLRYNRIQSPASLLAPPCTDCEIHPFGGLYAELLMPSRQVALYGELSLSRFRNELAQTYYINSTTYTMAYDVFDYRAWLGMARIGLRYFINLPHEQQLFFGPGLELNRVMGVRYTARYGLLERPAPGTEFSFAVPSLVPNLGVGWRRHRYSVGVDAQLYNTAGSTQGFGSGFALRLGLGYRLGRNSDTLPPAAPTSAASGR